MTVSVGLSVFGDARYRAAARPLFDDGRVDAIEWTVDSWLSGDGPPGEAAAWLAAYGANNALIAHGVHYPLLAAAPDFLRGEWLGKLSEDVKRHRYQGISVHFGFATGWELAEGAPLPVPRCAESTALGRDALVALHAVAGCDVGIENLALSFSAGEAASQGAFIDDLLTPLDGYLLLDLHNLYCQSVNFGIGMTDLARTYPLQRVREMHVSGGSWSGSDGARIRRDTHDDRVPDAVFAALPALRALCPRLEFVMLEQLPEALETDAQVQGFRADYQRLREVVHGG